MPSLRKYSLVGKEAEPTMRPKLERPMIRSVYITGSNDNVTQAQPGYVCEVRKSPRAPEYEVVYLKDKAGIKVKSQLKVPKTVAKGAPHKKDRKDVLSDVEGDTDTVAEDDEMVGLKVIACNKQDGLYYPGHVGKTSNTTYALVTFNFDKKQKVSTRNIIPLGGAVPRPELGMGDFALVQVYNQFRKTQCYVPAIVEFVPEDPRVHNRFYTMLLYNGQRETTLRRNIVKIGRERFEMAVRYIHLIQQTRDSHNRQTRQRNAKRSSSPISERSEDGSSVRSDRSHTSISTDISTDSKTRRRKKEKYTKKLAKKVEEDKRRKSRNSKRRSSRSSSGSRSRSSSRSSSRRSRKSRSRSRSSSVSRSRPDSRSRSRKNSRSSSGSRRGSRRGSRKLPIRMGCSAPRSRSDSGSSTRTPTHRSDSGSPTPRQSPVERPDNPVPRPRPLDPIPRNDSMVVTRTDIYLQSGDERGQSRASKQDNSCQNSSRQDSHRHGDKDQLINELQYQLEKQQRKQMRQEWRLIKQARKINKIQRKLKDTDSHNNSIHSDRPKSVSDSETTNKQVRIDESFENETLIHTGSTTSEIPNNTEVLACWPDDGWYYLSLVRQMTSPGHYLVEDSTGQQMVRKREDILTEDEHCGSLQPHDYVIGLHPNFECSYCPGKVVEVFSDKSVLVKFYDGKESTLTYADVYKISQEKCKHDMEKIIDCENKLVGQDVVARDDNTGEFIMGEVKHHRSEQRGTYLVRLTTNHDVIQKVNQILDIRMRDVERTDWQYTLAPADLANTRYLPARVIHTVPFTVQLCNMGRPVSVQKNLCFWINKQFYANAVNFYNSRHKHM